MTHIDHQVLFTALSFLAVLLQHGQKDKSPKEEAYQVQQLAQLFEAICMQNVQGFHAGEQNEVSNNANAKQQLNEYIAVLRDTGSADLSHDRTTLLEMYEMLLMRKVWREQKEFFATGHEDVIANRVLQLATEQIEAEAQS